MIMKNKNVAKSVLWFVFGFAVTALISIFLMQNHRLVIILLLLFSTGLILFFKEDLLKLVKNTKWYEAVSLISVSLLVHGTSSYLILKYLEQPEWLFDSRGSSFLLMNDFYVWAKPMDIMAQQLLILLLVLKLNDLKMSVNQITKLFVVGFGAAHVFQLLRTDLIIGLLYLVTAIIFSFVFPRMILKVRNGFIYNFMIHLFAYNAAAMVAWVLY